MIIKVDLDNDQIYLEGKDKVQIYPMDSEEAFSVLSKVWLRCGWDNKYVYSFTWMGRPIIQLPDDMIRIQEIVYRVKPDVIIETGIAHGGSLIFYASLCKAMKKGHVIGIDIEIRPHNRKEIEAHELYPYITLIEGDSIDPLTVAKVRRLVRASDKTIAMLDSRHTKNHVLAELSAYSSLVSVGSYIVAMDGIMKDLAGAPRSNADWAWNNPMEAAFEFVKKNHQFIIEEPKFPFNEGNITERVTYCPNAFIKMIS